MQVPTLVMFGDDDHTVNHAESLFAPRPAHGMKQPAGASQGFAFL